MDIEIGKYASRKMDEWQRTPVSSIQYNVNMSQVSPKSQQVSFANKKYSNPNNPLTKDRIESLRE